MPYDWIECVDGYMRLYMDYETEYEKRMVEYRRDWQRKKRANMPIKKRTKKKQSMKLKEKFICECGGGYSYKTNKYIHPKSKKHIKYLNELIKQKNLSFEIETIDTQS